MSTYTCPQGHVGEPYMCIRKDGLCKGSLKRECRVCRREAAYKYRKAHMDRYMKSLRESMSNVDFGGLRETAILRDNESCVSCGMTREQHKEKFGRDITVDHKDLNGCNKPRELKNNSLENLQTMCLPCHTRKDAKLRKELLSHAK